MAKVKESTFYKNLKRLEKYTKTKIWKMHGGFYSNNGWPDTVVVSDYEEGRFCTHCELKSVHIPARRNTRIIPPNKVTPLQQDTLEDIVEYGGEAKLLVRAENRLICVPGLRVRNCLLLEMSLYEYEQEGMVYEWPLDPKTLLGVIHRKER